ncbi:hypothetical protein J6590_045087 [Homalodisca vitripennis]|nr:hypothetical protein J6590_045087 [Homalodisca vitripennis]
MANTLQVRTCSTGSRVLCEVTASASLSLANLLYSKHLAIIRSRGSHALLYNIT